MLFRSSCSHRLKLEFPSKCTVKRTFTQHRVLHDFTGRVYGGLSGFRLPGDRVRVRRVEGAGILLEPMVTDIKAWFAELDRLAGVPLKPGERHWSISDRLCRESKASGNLVQDAWFGTLAVESGTAANVLQSDDIYDQVPISPCGGCRTEVRPTGNLNGYSILSFLILYRNDLNVIPNSWAALVLLYRVCSSALTIASRSISSSASPSFSPGATLFCIGASVVDVFGRNCKSRVSIVPPTRF